MCGYCRDRFAGALRFMWTQFDVDVDSKEIGNLNAIYRRREWPK